MPPEFRKGRNINGEPVEMLVEKMVWRPSVYALIFTGAGELLIQDNLHSHKYDLPGGGVEVWEQVTEALIREVWEETGLEAKIQDLVHVQDNFFLTPSGKHWHTLHFFYRAEVTGGIIRNSILEDEWTTNPHWVAIDQCTAASFTAGEMVWKAVQAALNP
ncbi:MAG: NUDIX domain-containing protein [Chloroflexi bacterium]|nr:NUDIX domain-containing protein [Chloroflexota bacterium]